MDPEKGGRQVIKLSDIKKEAEKCRDKLGCYVHIGIDINSHLENPNIEYSLFRSDNKVLYRFITIQGLRAEMNTILHPGADEDIELEEGD